MQFFKHLLLYSLLTIIMIAIPKREYAQQPKFALPPSIDTIILNTLDYIEIKNSLVRQYHGIQRKERQLAKTINVLNKHYDEIAMQQQSIKSELDAINRHIDSLIPPRPIEKRPRKNIIDYINEGITFTGSYGININQLALSNWNAGGESSVSGKGLLSFTLANMRKSHESKLVGKFAFGTSHFSNRHFEKSDDMIDLLFTLKRNTSNRINFSFVSNFQTQFANGYSYPNDSVRVSAFFAPAYFTISAGYIFNIIKDNLTCYLSPLAGKSTFVSAQDLADQGKFGVKAGYYAADSTWVPGERYTNAIGINLIINYKQPIGKNICYSSIFNAYYNYTELNKTKQVPFDMNWESNINITVSKNISAVLFVYLKYDHNTLSPIYKTIDGEETLVDSRPKLQFKESFGIAFLHHF